MAQSATLIFLCNILFPNGEIKSDLPKILPRQQKQKKLQRKKCQKCFKGKYNYEKGINCET